jgi:hypothetical protein
LTALSIHQDEYSHIVFIPLIVISLMYWRRRKAFANSAFPTYAGAILLFVGFALYRVAAQFIGTSTEPNVPSLSLPIIGFIAMGQVRDKSYWQLLHWRQLLGFDWMLQMRRLIWIIVCLFAFTVSARGQHTYYVSKSLGSDLRTAKQAQAK